MYRETASGPVMYEPSLIGLRESVHVCEQQRDYDASSGYLRAALRLSEGDAKLLEKRKMYEVLGKW